MQDAVAVASVCNGWSFCARGTSETSKDDVLRNWRRSGVNVATDTRVVEAPDIGILGYATFSDSFHDYAQLRGSVYMLPEYRRSEIESDLLDWIDNRAKESLRRITPGKRVALSHLALAKDRLRQDLLFSHGYRVVNHSIRMRLEFPGPTQGEEPQIPAGISIRACDRSRDLLSVSVVVQEAFREHHGFVERTTEDDVARYERWLNDDPNIDMGVWHLACTADDVIGVCLGSSCYSGNPNQAYIFTLGVREAWRGKGVGHALLAHAIDVFGDRGCTVVDLDVDTANVTGALRLYERAGMRAQWQVDEYEKELRARSET
jgi:ribosomal protein S18 acetylase RimI-like enzyme